MRFNYDAVKNSWEVFNKAYMPELSESEYMSFIEDVASVVDFSDKYYPQILFPKSFLDLISCRFETVTKNPLKTRIKIISLESIIENHSESDIEKDDSITWEKLCLLAENIKGYNFNLKRNAVSYPIKPSCPTKRMIAKYKVECVEKYNIGCATYVIFIISIITISLVAVSDSIFTAIWLAIFCCPALSLVFYISSRNGSYKKNVRVKRSQKEIEELEKKAEEEYSKAMSKYKIDIKHYELDRRIYDEYTIERNKERGSRDKFVIEHIDEILFNRIQSFNDSDYSSLERLTDPPQRGRSENLLFEALMERFNGKGVKIDMGIDNYAPDLVFIFRNEQRTCFFDIEIDEPYSYIGKKETHYKGCADVKRNISFQNRNWFVIRFSEEQIVNNLDSCVEFFVSVLRFVNKLDSECIKDVRSNLDKLQYKRWSKEEARLMAIRNHRDTY